MQDIIWEPLGMEYDGLWSIDQASNSLEKTFCSLAARAIDFAQFAGYSCMGAIGMVSKLFHKIGCINQQK